MSIYPVWIMVRGRVITASTNLKDNWVLLEECHHWWRASQEGGTLFTSPWNRRWVKEQLKGLVKYRDWDTAYQHNLVECDGGLYSGRLPEEVSPEELKA